MAAQDAPPQWGPRSCPASKSDEDGAWFLVFGFLHPLVFDQLPPNQHDRLTARGFTNQQ
jgi:hypothetical protein